MPDEKLGDVAGRIVASSIGRRIIPTPEREIPVVIRPDATPTPVDRIHAGPAIDRIPEALLLPFRVAVIRPDDLLVLEFELVNLEVRTKDSRGKRLAEPVVAVSNKDRDSFLIVHLPPQNIAEEAFWEKDPDFPREEIPGVTIPLPDEANDDLAGPPVQTRLAGPSRISFRVPSDATPIPFSTEGLLGALGGLELNVAGTAQPPPPPKMSTGLEVIDFLGTPRWVREIESTRAEDGPNDVAARTLMQRARAMRWREGAETEMRMAVPILRADVALDARGIVDRFGKAVVLKPPISKPEVNETAIEAPYRLILSPSSANAWAHRPGPAIGASGRVELWHTRLATRRNGAAAEGPDFRRKMRAVWARSGLAPGEGGDRPGEPTTSPKPRHENEPFRMSLDAFDRWDIVHLSSDYKLFDDPEPIDVDSFMLSSLGAWIDTRGQWDLNLAKYPDGYPSRDRFEVQEWKHRGTMGRDHYVRVVYAGYLFPFGHKASLVKVTERKFHGDRDGNPAYLRQRMFVVVRRPLKEFRATNLSAADDTPLAKGTRLYDRQFPFSSVRITTLVTPNLDDPEESDYADCLQTLFWPRVRGVFFKFHLVGVDLEGNTVEFTAPLAFTGESVAFDQTLMKTLRDDFETKQGDYSKIDLFGQKVAYAESERSGDTSFETESVTFGAEVAESEKALGEDHPMYYPCIRRSALSVPAVKQFTGKTGPTMFAYSGSFLEEGEAGGFGGANAGQVFLEVSDGGLAMDFTSAGDRAGGMLQPNFQVKGLSRLLGPVSGKDDLFTLIGGQFDPLDFFAGLEAKLFGVLDLKDIIAAVGLDDLEAVPKFLSEQFTAAEAFIDDLERLRAELEELKANAGAQAASLQAPLDKFKADYEKVTADIHTLIVGAAGVALEENLGSLSKSLDAALAVIEGLPPEVGSARDKALLRIRRFTTTIANVEAFVGRLVDALALADELKTRFEWKPKLQSWPSPKSQSSPSSKPIFIAERNGSPAVLTLSAEIQAKSKLKPDPSVDILCRLENFSLDLVGSVESFIKLHFDKIEFISVGGAKADVNVEFAGIEFVGPLAFVEALRGLIPMDGFSDPPALDVSEKGIEASFSLALPSVAVGVFSLQNLSLGAGFKVPFVGDPLSVRFQFCERESPFLLTVSMFGGGGFFGIEINPDGVKTLEAAFEFGASVSVDLGVASGGVYVMAGIYFKIQEGKAELTGYLRMGGNVEVLGIVSVSIELNMSLTWEEASGKCVGRATLSIEIEIAFFSETVEISCERKFAGSNGDPSFAQLMEPEPEYDPWDEYCEAFA